MWSNTDKDPPSLPPIYRPTEAEEKAAHAEMLLREREREKAAIDAWVKGEKREAAQYPVEYLLALELRRSQPPWAEGESCAIYTETVVAALDAAGMKLTFRG